MTDIDPIVALSIIYRFRHEKRILEEAINQLREAVPQCNNATSRSKIVRKIREWSYEMRFIQDVIDQRTLEFQVVYPCERFFQHDLSRIQEDINRQDHRLVLYKQRKQATINRLTLL